MLADIAAVIAPIFICAGIGFAWGRANAPFNTEMVTNLALNLGVPCLIFSTLTKLEVPPEAFATVAGAYVAVVAANFAIGFVALRLAGLEWNAFLPPLVFANNGNMGLPLCLFAFGDQGLAFAISVFVISSVGTFTIGLSTFAGSFAPKVLLKNPLLYVVALALVFMIGAFKPPAWLANTTAIVGGLGIPMMLISLGVAMSRIKVASLKRSLALSLLRLGMGLALGIVIAWAFGLTGVARGVIILQAAMPTAVNNYLFAQRYDRRPGEVAGMVVISTAISFATLPILLWFVLQG